MRTFVQAYTAECKDSKQNIVIIIIYCHERMRSFVILIWLVMGKFVKEVEAGNINETGAKHILAKKIYVRILCCSYLYTPLQLTVSIRQSQVCCYTCCQED